MKLIIGSHVSFKKEDGLLGSVKEALSYKANTFMFYTGAPQNAKRLPINMELVDEAKKMMIDNGIDINNVIVHAPYIINLANKNNLDFSISFLKQELRRVKELGVKILVLHPGSHVGVGILEGIHNISFALNMVKEEAEGVFIALETMAGKGSEIASNFEEIKTIMNEVNYPLYVCLDTCHINDAGYDLNDFESVLNQFDSIIGLDKIKCVHINDSLNERASHKDRHANIGMGTIGFNNLLNVIYNERLKGIPKILETPYVVNKKYPPYRFEIAMIRAKKFNENLLEDIENYYK